MGIQSMANFKWPGLLRPDGEPLTLNRGAFLAVDLHKDITYDPVYRPQAVYHRALEGLRATNDVFLLQEVATNLPIYREDTGPTDFHLHLPPGAFQLVVVTSGLFTFDYDGLLHYVGPGAVILQSAIVHRQLSYTWSGLATDENLHTPQSVVPESLCMGYSGKFLEAFITDPSAFPNPSVVGSTQIKEDETSRLAWAHPLHNRPLGADFWFQDPLALGAQYRLLASDLPGGPIRSASPVYVRELGIEAPSGHLATAQIIATDPRGTSLLPKSNSAKADLDGLGKGEVDVYRLIRGAAEFTEASGKVLKLVAGDTVTARKGEIRLSAMEDDTQILRIGLLKGIESLRRWTPTQRDEIEGLGGQIMTQSELRPERASGKPVGYLYE